MTSRTARIGWAGMAALLAVIASTATASAAGQGSGQPMVSAGDPKGPPSRMSYASPAPQPATRPAPVDHIDPALTRTKAAASAITPPLAVRGGDAATWVLRQGWVSVGGRTIGDPAAAIVPAQGNVPARPLYVVTGADGNIWIRDDSSWWQPLTPAGTACTGAPGAVVVPDAGTPGAFLLAAACRGTDGGLWTGTASVGSSPAPLPQISLSSVGGLLHGLGVSAALIGSAVGFVGTGGDSHPWLIEPGERGWQQLPIQCLSSPAAGGSAALSTVACVGLDSSVVFTTFSNGAWSGSSAAGGCFLEIVAVRPLAGASAVDAENCNGSAWEVQVSAAGIAWWVGMGGGIAGDPQPGYFMQVPVIAQSMPLDCETASVEMGLAYLGHDSSQRALFPLESPDTRRAVWAADGLHWGDPYTNFVGNVWGSERDYTGYGVYYPPILAIARAYGAPSSTGGEGYRPLDIYNALAEGHPVIVWVEYQWARPRVGTWIAWDGRHVNYTTWEHTVTLRGVTATQVLVNDPHPGNTYWLDRSTFEASFRDFGNMAVIVQ